MDGASPDIQWRVLLSRRSHRIIWILSFCLYFATAVSSCVVAYLYLFVLNLNDGYYFVYIGALPTKYILVVITSYGVAGVLCIRAMLHMLYASCRKRHLAFAGEVVRIEKTSKPGLLSHTVVKKLWDQGVYMLCARRGLCGVESPRFDLIFLFREALEVVLQTYQCYKASWLLSRVWINSAYVGVLAINCWCTPLVLMAVKRDLPRQRLYFLLNDVILDFISAIVVPGLIFYDTFGSNVGLRARPGVVYLFDIPYNDVYLIDLLLALKQIVTMNWLDWVSKLMPIFSLISCLNKVQLLAQTKLSPTSGAIATKQIVPSPTPADRPRSGSKTRSSSFTDRNQSHLQLLASRTERLLHRSQVLLALWGVTVTALHLHANMSSFSQHSVTSELGCKSRVHPWLVHRLACSVLELNCVERQITGSLGEIDEALAQLEPQALSSLIITHCPALAIPPRIQTFVDLIGFEVTNATLIEWRDDAALHDHNHRTFHFLSFVRMNLTAIPDGLLADDFPKALRDIHIVATNLSTVPSDLDLIWPNTINLYLERNAFTEIPDAVARMHVSKLSVLGNDITSIPDSLLEDNAFAVLSLARNPIRHLPASIGSHANIYAVVLDFSGVEQVPAWLASLATSGRVVVSAGGTPFCLNHVEEAKQLGIVCSIRPDDEFEAYAFQQNLADRRIDS